MKKLLLFMIFALSFGMNAQTIQSVTPNAANAGETLQVTITGNSTQFLTISDTYGVNYSNNTVSFGIIALEKISNTEINTMVAIPINTPTGFYTLGIEQLFPYTYIELPNAFYVTNNNNVISGVIKLDANGNGCDASDANKAGVKVNINNGTSDSYTFTNASGEYVFYVPAGDYVVTPQPELPYFTASPASATINFPTSGNLSQIQNFCLVPNGVHNDVYVALLPLTVARPGFNATYRVFYKNNGNQPLSGSLNFTFDDSRLDFVSSTVAPASQTLNNLNWNYVNLLPFQSQTIDFVLNANSPTETPAVNIGDVFNFTATVNPVSGDDTPDDNVNTFNQNVVGSYDPNDKAVAEGAQVNITNAGDYLHYVIRFQNSGNFLAENIRVLDMLSSNLDKSTLQVLSASHPYRSTLTAGNKLEFFFDNINLPPESVNEPGSHGFIAFKIKPSNTVVLGSVIENTADIYFDFNFPIVTNTVSTTFTTLGNPHVDFANSILLYPNPVGNSLNIENQSSSEITSVKIFNQLGQLVKTINNPNSTIAVGDLQTGTYFVKITSDKGTATKKLIKL